MMRCLRYTLLLSCTAAALRAQVGTSPEKSPFRDLHDSQRIGIVAGYLTEGDDPAGVGPKSAPAFGVRYDLFGKGPAYFTVRVLGSSTERDVLDYTKSPALRKIGTTPVTVVNTDLGLTLALTGDRTWHGLQPLTHLGVGLSSAFHDKQDLSGYYTAPSFLLSWGLGTRFVTSRNSELRVDLDWYMRQLKYPATYRSTAADPIAIHPTGSMSPWIRSRGISAAWTWGIFR